MMDTNKLIEELTRDEALRLKPYRDTVGKLTIGIGRNLDDVGITRDEAFFLAKNDIARVVVELNAHLPWWGNLDDVRQRVLANMCFNMGLDKLLEFHNTLALIQSGRYESAAIAMLESKWASQVGARAKRLAMMMRTGTAV